MTSFKVESFPKYLVFNFNFKKKQFSISGNDPIKNHCAIPLDGSANRGKDPRHRKYSQTSTSLPLPKFIHEHRPTTNNSRRSHILDPFRSPLQHKHETKCSRNSVPASSSSLAG